VATKKNATANDAGGKITCEVAMSMEDFLHIYSGKASSSDVVKLFYAGRVSISGYAFRTMSNFVASFDYSTDSWNNFYAQQRDRQQRSSAALDETRNVGSPSRDFWFYYCRAMLERHNISKLQRITWEASLASLFGDQFILDNLRRSVRSRRSSSVDSALNWPQHGQIQGGLVAALAGVHIPPPPSRIMDTELTHSLHPSMTRRRHSIATGLTLRPKAHEDFGVFDEALVDAVKHASKRRASLAQTKNRVDLADVGMEQLDKLLVAWGKDGHRNTQCKTKPRYIPAPELLLREFQSQATELVHVIQEKALGRKRVDRIPPPDTAWLCGADSGVLVVTDSGRDHSVQASPSANPSTAPVRAAAAQALVVVDRSQAPRRGSMKRDFEVPKQKILAKFASLSRDLAKHQAATRPLTFDDHVIFSDYV
jgi:hypothetical protein